MPTIPEKVLLKIRGASRWPWTDAKVFSFELSETSRSGQRHAALNYSFWVREHIYSAVATWYQTGSDEPYMRDDTIQIQYNPSDPNQSYFPEQEDPSIAFYLMLAAVVLVSALICLAFTR